MYQPGSVLSFHNINSHQAPHGKGPKNKCNESLSWVTFASVETCLHWSVSIVPEDSLPALFSYLPVEPTTPGLWPPAGSGQWGGSTHKRLRRRRWDSYPEPPALLLTPKCKSKTGGSGSNQVQVGYRNKMLTLHWLHCAWGSGFESPALQGNYDKTNDNK